MQLVQSIGSDIGKQRPTTLARSVLVGLIGGNIQQSRTPRMHEVEGARLGLRYSYKLVDVAVPRDTPLDIGQIVSAATLFGFAGLNVTYPYKQAIMPHLDVIDEGAARVGAVNTVVFSQGKTFGYNTDLWGFAQGFRLEMAQAPLGRVLQLGAGGAGSAVANALVECGVHELVIADLDTARACNLAERLTSGSARVSALPLDQIAAIKFDGIVNTTPMGMDKNPGMPIDPAMLNPSVWVADIVYFPLETALLASARARGCRTLSGAAMAVFQAVKAFELFTGIAADADAMRATFNAFETTKPWTETAD